LARLLACGAVSKLHIDANSCENLGDDFLDRTGSKVVVVTDHPMSQEHYIVRNTLPLADGTFVGAKTFTPTDKPEATYDLPHGYKGRFYVSSFCNLHDFWLLETKA
jgi:superoxide reductase